MVIIVSAFNEITIDGEVYVVCEPGVLAFARTCVLDQFDRPIVGFVNFCLDEFADVRQLDADNGAPAPDPKAHVSNVIVEAKFDNAEGTAMEESTVDEILITTHEIGHVLGVTNELFIFFRDPTTGLPRTSRPLESKDVICINGTTEKGYFPDDNTIKTETTSENRLSYVLVTPRVATVARNQFDCQSLEGARLENIPDESCTGSSHFDERQFYSELMGPISSGTSDILSPLTLALLEDSGWYQVTMRGVKYRRLDMAQDVIS